MRTLGQVHAALGNSFEDMLALVEKHLHADDYTKEELGSALGIEIAGWSITGYYLWLRP